MNHLDALRRMVLEYPGGGEAVSARLGKSWETLRKELRAAPGFKLGVSDAMQIAEFCVEQSVGNRLDFTNAVNAATGCMALPLPDSNMENLPKNVAAALQQLGGAAGDFGAFVQSVAGSVADHRVSQNELLDVHRKLLGLVAECQHVVSALEAIHRAGVPDFVKKCCS